MFIICLLYVYLFIILGVDLIETAISTSTTAATTEKQNNNKILSKLLLYLIRQAFKHYKRSTTKNHN